MREYNEYEKRLITQVLPGIARELRGAMANIYIAAERLAPLEKRETDAATDQNAAIFTQSFYRMHRVLGNLTAAADLAGTGMYPTLINDDIVGLTRTVCEKSETLFAYEGVTLVFESDHTGHIIALESKCVEHMLYNLLSNALKFTPKGGTVSVRIHVTEQSVLLTVSDTGCGIAPDKLDGIFSSFLDGEFIRPYPCGTGLGLAICRRVAQGHGGSIVVESKEGEGSRFTVSLPNRRLNTVVVRQPQFEYKGGFNPTLVELSDALGIDAFTCRHLD